MDRWAGGLELIPCSRPNTHCQKTFTLPINQRKFRDGFSKVISALARRLADKQETGIFRLSIMSVAATDAHDEPAAYLARVGIGGEGASQ